MNKIILILAALVLVGCVSPKVRGVEGDYSLIASSKVPVSSLPAFRDCASDALHDRTFGLGVQFINRQQRRSDHYRVELVDGDVGPLLSADIYDDGRVELFEINVSAKYRHKDATEAFSQCLTRFK